MNTKLKKKQKLILKKTQKYQTCNSRKEKKSFSIRTKLLHYKVFYSSNRNDKNSNTNE